jgi:tRNA-specific 2-thiouridylase
VLGRHRGVHHFTVGQRKGLGLATGAPLYVLELQPEAQTVVVGPRAALERTRMFATDVNWIAGEAPAGSTRVAVQIRHQHGAAPATLLPHEDDVAEVRFDRPQVAISPGQAAVFYSGELVLGGGWITREV